MLGRAEEPGGQESERSSERGRAVMGLEQRSAGRWMHGCVTDRRQTDASAQGLCESERATG